ncbi:MULTISPECIES: hypothetical protein [Ramlibacter]|uniref:Uncharacterized protein n=1 Tax=Ramlibacter pinisoli TaxID=2682844 RepID=A0A6N8IU31_9BURK|nr:MULTISPECIES: hypothetical protein [Ramlibacter]MBA2964457.1 hypothetical protein [Ramlibacter sp. CGMCC 1.13660]MVQ29423.1 hypothetical protein [Ramlibacter pinisoli]
MIEAEDGILNVDAAPLAIDQRPASIVRIKAANGKRYIPPLSTNFFD